MLDYLNLLLLSFSFCSSFRVGAEQIAFFSLCVAALALVCSHKCRCCQGTKRRAQPILCLGRIMGHPGVTCTLRTLFAARLGTQWMAVSVAHLGKQGEQQIPNHPIGITPASMHLGSTLARYAFSRAELQHLFPVCYRPVYLTVVRTSRSLH